MTITINFYLSIYRVSLLPSVINLCLSARMRACGFLAIENKKKFIPKNLHLVAFSVETKN